MSTRCQIIVEGSDVVIYRHCDGYPEGPHGVVRALKKSVMNFIKYRGFDECYMPAHIVSDMIVAHKASTDKTAKQMAKAGLGSSHYEASKYLGYGVEAYIMNDAHALHGDIEFLYVVKKNGTIEVRSCFENNDGPENITNTKVIKTVKYAPKKALA